MSLCPTIRSSLQVSSVSSTVTEHKSAPILPGTPRLSRTRPTSWNRTSLHGQVGFDTHTTIFSVPCVWMVFNPPLLFSSIFICLSTSLSTPASDFRHYPLFDSINRLTLYSGITRTPSICTLPQIICFLSASLLVHPLPIFCLQGLCRANQHLAFAFLQCHPPTLNVDPDFGFWYLDCTTFSCHNQLKPCLYIPQDSINGFRLRYKPGVPQSYCGFQYESCHISA